MSRLDSHVMAVQNKLALNRFLDGLAVSLPTFALAAWATVRVEKIFGLHIANFTIWLSAGAALAVGAALAYAVWRRPSAYEAAVKIDEKLNTKDKFATALHVRTMSDPFAHAALLDAERSAENVTLHKQFPWTPSGRTYQWRYLKFGVVAVLIGLSHLLNPIDAFGKKEEARKQAEQTAAVERATKQLKDALAQVSNIPQALQQDENIKLAKEQLLQQLSQAQIDPVRANRTAAKALQDVTEAIKQQAKSNQKFVEAQNDAKMLRQLNTPTDEKGPIAEAQRELSKGNFEGAINELTKTVENFDKMEKKDQENAAKQMQNMAKQLQQMANNPQQQQQMQNQLQQMGLNKQDAQQAQDLMQKAANGDQKAQEKLQDMAQQMMRQMNNGQGPNQQQQQQIQQMMQQMQQMANNQQQAQQLAQAAQQMAQAMQQQAAQKNGLQQNQQQGQQAKQGNKQGQQQQQGQNKGMGQGMQQMQQQLQQMQADAQAAQQIAAAQQQMQQAANGAMNQMNGQAGQNGGDAAADKPGQGGQGGWNANGQIQGDPNKQNNPWNGQAGQAGPNQGGRGAGDRSYKAQAPYAVKPEISPSIDDEKGKILASTLVKASALNNGSKEQVKEIAESAVKDAADEVDQDRVSRQAQKVVREYFGSMQKDAETAANPTTAPSN